MDSVLYDQFVQRMVGRIEDDFFFLNGWAEFGKDNTVELGDFLVFQYDGNCVYDVILLGHNACEKKGVGAFKVKEEEEETKGFEEDDEVKEEWDEEGKSNEFGKEEEEEQKMTLTRLKKKKKK
nr:putative B3 domain-containing protein At5g66980 [Coffea arabica]